MAPRNNRTQRLVEAVKLKEGQIAVGPTHNERNHPVLRLRQGLGDGHPLPDHGVRDHHPLLQANAQDAGLKPTPASEVAS